jgi:hypothetical protein
MNRKSLRVGVPGAIVAEVKTSSIPDKVAAFGDMSRPSHTLDDI